MWPHLELKMKNMSASGLMKMDRRKTSLKHLRCACRSSREAIPRLGGSDLHGRLDDRRAQRRRKTVHDGSKMSAAADFASVPCHRVSRVAPVWTGNVVGTLCQSALLISIWERRSFFKVVVGRLLKALHLQ